jgi:hypothetical protein
MPVNPKPKLDWFLLVVVVLGTLSAATTVYVIYRLLR